MKNQKGFAPIIIAFIAAVIFAGLFYIFLHNQTYQMPMTAAPPPPFSLCEADSDCIHVRVLDDTSIPYVEPIIFQSCINKNYKEADLEYHLYGKIQEKTGKDLCECSGEEPKTCVKTHKITEANITKCAVNSDCIIVNYEDCCASKKAINKKYLDEYNNHPEWQKASKERMELCVVMECDDETRGLDYTKCENNKCVLTSDEPISKKIIDTCEEDVKLIEAMQSNPDCLAGKKFRCVDGWSMVTYYNKRLTDNADIPENNAIDSPFVSEEVKQATIATRSTSVCSCEKPISYMISKDDELGPVSCDEFYDFLNSYNQSCNDCLENWESGCC